MNVIQVGRMVEIKGFPIAAIGEIGRLEQKINRSISNSSLNDIELQMIVNR